MTHLDLISKNKKRSNKNSQNLYIIIKEQISTIGAF